MKRITLNNICSLVTDGTHDSPKILVNGMPLIKGKDISSGTINFDNCDYISYEDYIDVIKRVKPKKDDVLFANIGSVGDVARVSNSTDFAIKNVALFRPDPKKIDIDYFYYFIKSNSFKAGLLNYQSGSAQPYITLDVFRKYRFYLSEDISIQKKIASIICPYDDLITTNRRRIQLLEESARLLFREWFVFFRFPRLRQGFGGQAGHQKACPVESINSTGVKIVDGVPEGWKKEHLSKLVTTQYGYTETASQEEIGPKFLRGTDINKTSYIDWASVPYCPNEKLDFRKYSLSRGDILIIRMADPGKVGIVEVEIEAIFASYLVRLKVINKSISSYYFIHYWVINTRDS